MPKNSKSSHHAEPSGARPDRSGPSTDAPPHDYRRNRVGNYACTACGVRRVVAASGSVAYKHRDGSIALEARPCRVRTPQNALPILAAVQGVRGGLTAEQLIVICGHLPEATVREQVARLSARRYIELVGDSSAPGSYVLAARGARHLAEAAAKDGPKRPRGRPRKYPPGEAPKRAYKPTGRPMGRPRKRDLAAAPPPPKREGKLGRPRMYDDDLHERQRAYVKRWREAKRLGVPMTRKSLRDLSPAERTERAKREKERARVAARSWRRWERAVRLAVRHWAASPPQPDALSDDARAWLVGGS